MSNLKELNWDEINKILSQCTKLHKCEKCGEFGLVDIISSTLKAKILCMECGKNVSS